MAVALRSRLVAPMALPGVIRVALLVEAAEQTLPGPRYLRKPSSMIVEALV